MRADVAAGGVLGLQVARVTEDLLLVGDGDRNGGRRGQKQLADFLRGFAIQAVLHALERLARQAQHGVRLARAYRIRVHRQADHQHDRKREHDTCGNHDGDAVRRGERRPKKRHARKDRDNRKQHLDREHAGDAFLRGDGPQRRSVDRIRRSALTHACFAHHLAPIVSLR